MNKINAIQISEFIREAINDWHVINKNRPQDYEIVTEDIRRIKPLNLHRDDILQVVKELVDTNTEMWHEEDKIRSEKDEIVLRAIRNVNPLNQHRNDLIEEIDEIFLEMADRRGTDGNRGQSD